MTDAQAAVLDLTKPLEEMMKARLGLAFVVFNPSICRIARMKTPYTYLVSFRFFRGLNDNDDPLNRIGIHPWASKWKGIDGTGFAKLVLNKNGNVQSLTPVDVVSNLNNKTPPHMFKNGLLYECADLRVYHYKTGNADTLLLSFNVWSSEKNLPTGLIDANKPLITQKGGLASCTKDMNKRYAKCTGHFCTHIATANAVLDGNELKVETFIFECPQCSKQHEKNWTFFQTNGQLKIAYGIQDKYVFLQEQECAREEVQSLATQYLEKLNNTYGIIFSLSTPAVDWNNQYLLAVGHAKITKSNVNKRKWGNGHPLITDLVEHPSVITTKAGRHFSHKHYYYFLYLYLINKQTNAVDFISHLIIPHANEPYSVYFPSGLERFGKDSFIIAYGVGDATTKFAIMSHDDIANLLITKPKDHMRIKYVNTIVIDTSTTAEPMSVDDQERSDPMDTA